MSNVADGYFVPASFMNDCPNCGLPYHIAVPRRDARKRLSFYGDEAERVVERNSERLYYFCLALAAISPDILQATTQKIGSIEKLLTSTSGGTVTWLHAKDIMDSKRWPKSISPAFRRRYLQKAANIASNRKISKFVVAGCATWNSLSDQKFVRDQVFSAAYLFCMEMCLSSGIVPVFHFDRQKAGKKNGWSEECILGLRYLPSFVWVASGNHIDDPTFVDPGSTSQSKIADLIAYFTAREFERKVRGLDVDFASASYGRAQHAGYDVRGDLVFSGQIGFPTKMVFGI